MKSPITILLTIALIGSWGFFYMKHRLIEAQPLKEIEIYVPKLPEYRFEWRVCLKKYPDIKEHGAAFRCVKEQMYRADI